jgi:hypothetical protein
MSTLRVCSVVAILLILAACSTAPRSSLPPSATAEGREGEDSIRLTNGEVVRGRIVEETARQVVIERESVVSTFPRAAIFGIDYSKQRWQERKQPLQSSETASAAARPASTWLPRSDPREPVQQTEVLFYDTHALADCVGPALAQAHQDLPDLRLFAEPGGKIVLHDPKQWGYHAHLPGGALRIPAGKPGLTIDLPKDEGALPDTIAFVSPAQEIKAGEGETRTSYALPDAVYAAVKPMSTAEAMLAVQPFAGGKPAATPNGTMWAFTLPRNSRQFFVYLLDQNRRHGEILKASYVGFGETILAADLIIDIVGADGVAVGRVLEVPYPDNLSADGPAREPLVVYAGPTKDPTTILTLPLPPREAVQLPMKASSMKADVLVSHYEVSASVPQSLVLAYGVGRPTKDVKLISRELTPKEPDEIVKIDVSSLPEERFPAVVWLYQRRTFAWKTTGGFLPRVAEAALPPRRELKLAKVKRSEAIPHVIPLLFTGPKPASGPAVARGVDPAAQVAGGMANGLLRDALMREAGGIGNLTQNIAPAAGTPSGDGTGSVSNVTYVNITSPPHTPGMESVHSIGGSDASGGGGYGMNYQTAGGAPAMFAPGSPGNGPGGYAFHPSGTLDTSTGRTYNRSGSVTYDPRTGATSSSQGDDYNYNVGGVGVPIRRARQ